MFSSKATRQEATESILFLLLQTGVLSWGRKPKRGLSFRSQRHKPPEGPGSSGTVRCLGFTHPPQYLPSMVLPRPSRMPETRPDSTPLGCHKPPCIVPAVQCSHGRCSWHRARCAVPWVEAREDFFPRGSCLLPPVRALCAAGRHQALSSTPSQHRE